MRFFFYFAIIFVTACVKDVAYELDFEGTKIFVYATGSDNEHINLYLTKTIAPLTVVDDPLSLAVTDAEIEVYENDTVIDTMRNIGNGKYQSNSIIKNGNYYHLLIKLKNGEIIRTSKEIVPKKAIILNSELKLNRSEGSAPYINYYFNSRLMIQKSEMYPYNEIEIEFYFKDGIEKSYYYLNALSDFTDCQTCFNLLDNECVQNLGNSTYSLENEIKLNYPKFDITELDSVRFYLLTYNSIAEKLCQNGIDYEEYYNNPLPFAANPSVDYTNILGGYGLFILTSIDTFKINY